jgi:histidine ammonia-lyase
MALEYTAHAAAAEIRLLAAPAAAQHTSVGGGMESHASFAALAVRHTGVVLDRYADALATELVLSSRALRVAGRPPAGDGTRALFDAAVAALPAELEDRPLSGDLQRARNVLDSHAPALASPAV